MMCNILIRRKHEKRVLNSFRFAGKRHLFYPHSSPIFPSGKLAIMRRKTLSAILMVTIAFPYYAGAATNPSVGYQTDAANLLSIDTKLEKMIREIEEARSFVDRSQFELEALLDKLDYNPMKIKQFVKEQIAFEQYPGLLRGAQGTLMGRAGNSLDQSVLLAALLKDAGLEAEIVRSKLSQNQAHTLVEQMLKHVPSRLPPGDLDAIATVLGGNDPSISDISATPPPPSTAEESTQEVARFLLDTVKAQGQIIGSPDSKMAMIEEARDYFWVRHRDGPSSVWAAAHPAFGNSDLESPQPEAVTTYRGSIPDELQHRFRIEVFLEQKFGDQLRVTALIPAWERPASNMLGRSFVIGNYPNGIKVDTPWSDFDSQLRKSELFVPALNGKVLPDTKGFDLDGTPYDLDTQGADTLGATPIFRELGRSMDRVTGALGATGSAEKNTGPVRALSAEWIDYSLISPNGKTRTFRRYLFDRLGVETGREEKISALPTEPAKWWVPIASQEFILAGANYPDALILDEFLVRLAGYARLVQTFLVNNELTPRDLEVQIKSSRGTNALTLLALLEQMERPAGADPVPTYRSEPTLLALPLQMTAEDQVSYGTDIISNQRRSRQFTTASSGALDVMLQGIWETYTERLFFDLLGLDVPNLTSAFDQLAEHQGVPGQAKLLSLRSNLKAVALDISPPLRRDLDGGYLAVLPEIDSYRSVGWWRVDPHSGTTLGVAPNGRGATATEYLLPFGAIAAVLLALLVPSVVECNGLRNEQRKRTGREPQGLTCCVIQTNAKSLRKFNKSFAEVLEQKFAAADYGLRRIEAYGARNCE